MKTAEGNNGKGLSAAGKCNVSHPVFCHFSVKTVMLSPNATAMAVQTKVSANYRQGGDCAPIKAAVAGWGLPHQTKCVCRFIAP